MPCGHQTSVSRSAAHPSERSLRQCPHQAYAGQGWTAVGRRHEGLTTWSHSSGPKFLPTESSRPEARLEESCLPSPARGPCPGGVQGLLVPPHLQAEEPQGPVAACAHCEQVLAEVECHPEPQQQARPAVCRGGEPRRPDTRAQRQSSETWSRRTRLAVQGLLQTSCVALQSLLASLNPSAHL